MFRTFHNPRASSTQARNQTPPWRSVFIALVLTMLIGGAGQPALAQAAPAGDASIGVYMFARQLEPQTLCVGNNTPIVVIVFKKFEVVGEAPVLGGLIGVEVQALVTDSSIGSINPSSSLTSMNSEGRAWFIFSAEKPGTTIIQFWGKVSSLVFLGLEISSDTVTTELSVTVEECQYKVTTLSKWQPGGIVNMRIVAWIHEAGLVDGGTGRYTGTGSVLWTLATDKLGDCNAQSVTTTSQAELTGVRDDELTVDVAFDTGNISLPTFCVREGVAQGSTPVALTPDPVTFTVPASGGRNRYTHVLQGPEGPISGSVVVIVTRVNP